MWSHTWYRHSCSHYRNFRLVLQQELERQQELEQLQTKHLGLEQMVQQQQQLAQLHP
jgi:hypothetical protein